MSTYSAMGRICDSAWRQNDPHRRVKHLDEAPPVQKRYLMPDNLRTDDHSKYIAKWNEWSLKLEALTGMRVASRDPDFELTDGVPSHNIRLPAWFVKKLLRIEKKIKKTLTNE